MKNKYYAVKDGKIPGIYSSWSECEAQVRGYSGAIYKKFSTYEEACEFINGTRDNLISENKAGQKTRPRKDEKEEEVFLEQVDLKNNEAIAYVDGSFDLANWTFSYGVVFITQTTKEDYSGRDDDETLAKMRNVSGELKGAMVAMDIAVKQNIKTLYLHFDYTGIERWAKGDWKTNKEGTKFYKNYYDSIKDKVDVVFIKVKAHAGIKYNEEADKLAKEAIILK